MDTLRSTAGRRTRKPVSAALAATALLVGFTVVAPTVNAEEQSAELFTPGESTWVVPAGVCRITVVLGGGSGGNGGTPVVGAAPAEATGTGGTGDVIGGTLDVVEGETLTLVVGGAGADGGSGMEVMLNAETAPGPYALESGYPGLGGVGGGGTGGPGAAGGGGASWILRGFTPLAVAGGGGGAGDSGPGGMGGDGGAANMPGSAGAAVIPVTPDVVPPTIPDTTPTSPTTAGIPSTTAAVAPTLYEDAYSATGGGAGSLAGGGAAGTEVGSTAGAPPSAEASPGVFGSGGNGGAGPDSGAGGGGGLFGGGGGGVGYYASGGGGGGGASLVPEGGASFEANTGDGGILVTWDAASGEGCTPVEVIATPKFTG